MATNIAARHAVKGMVRTHLYDKTNPAAIFLIPCPAASEITINPQDQFQELYDADCNGNQVLAYKTENQSQTQLQITFSSATIDLKAAALKTRMTLVASGDVPYTRGWFSVPDEAAPTLDAAATGVYGDGVVADTAAYGTYINDNGVSIELTQLTDAGINPASDTFSFAIGADGALKFTNDLRGKVVSIGGAVFTVANHYSNTTAIAEMSLEAAFVDSYKKLNILSVPSFSPERQSTSIANPQQTIGGTVNGAYSIISVQQTNIC